MQPDSSNGGTRTPEQGPGLQLQSLWIIPTAAVRVGHLWHPGSGRHNLCGALCLPARSAAARRLSAHGSCPPVHMAVSCCLSAVLRSCLLPLPRALAVRAPVLSSVSASAVSSASAVMSAVMSSVSASAVSSVRSRSPHADANTPVACHAITSCHHMRWRRAHTRGLQDVPEGWGRAGSRTGALSASASPPATCTHVPILAPSIFPELAEFQTLESLSNLSRISFSNLTLSNAADMSGGVDVADIQRNSRGHRTRACQAQGGRHNMDYNPTRWP